MNVRPQDNRLLSPTIRLSKRLRLTCSSWVPFGPSHALALGVLKVAMGIEGICALAAAIALILLIVAVVNWWLLGGSPGTFSTLGSLREIIRRGDIRDLLEASVRHVELAFLLDRKA